MNAVYGCHQATDSSGEVRRRLTVYKDKEDEDGYVEDDEEDPPKGMVPLADMLNADAERNNARLSHVGEHLIMEAIKPIQRGEEIFNDYGALPRSALLRMYGYITDNYAQYDLVELPTEMIYEAATDSRNKKSLKTPDLEDFCGVEDGYSVSRPENGTALTQALDSDLQIVINAFASGDPEDLEKERELSLIGLALLHDVLVKRLKCYKLCKAYEVRKACTRSLAEDHQFSPWRRLLMAFHLAVTGFSEPINGRQNIRCRRSTRCRRIRASAMLAIRSDY